MDGFKDPYSGLSFDPNPFDKEITKVRDSFDATLSEAGMQAGMAAGNTGLNPGRVTADVYTRGASERDRTIAGLEGEKARAMTEFNTNKQMASANARAEYERNKPGFLDWLSFGTELAGAVVNPIMSIGALNKLGSNIGKGKQTTAGKLTQTAPTAVNTEAMTFKPDANTMNYNPTGFKPLAFNNFKQKKKSFWDNPGQLNLQF